MLVLQFGLDPPDASWPVRGRTSRLRSMSIASRIRRTPAANRSARWLAAALLAPAVLAFLVVPALAADPGTPEPTASPSASPSASPTVPPPTSAPWPTPSFPSSITTLDSTVKLYGKGYGHGVGMSQYGAKGRALAGETAEQILAAYFKGAVVGAISDSRQVRVRLLAGYRATSSAPLIIKGRGGAWAISTSTVEFPADATLRAWRVTTTVDGSTTTAWKARVVATDGSVLYVGKVSGKPVVRPVDEGAYLRLVSKQSTYDSYRGTLTLVLKSSSLRS